MKSQKDENNPSYLQTLNRYNFNDLEHFMQVLFIREQNIKYKTLNNSHKPQISKQEIELSKKMSYKELFDVYSINQCNQKQAKRIIRYKYYEDDIIRAHQFHKTLWKILSKAEFKMKQQPKYYSILNSQSYPEYFKKVIQADVHRTLQQKSQQNQKKLNNVLRNIAKRNPYIGYCQGMNFIINFLIIMQFEEDQIFWIMNSLLQDILPSNYYTNMLGVAVDLKIIEQFLRLKRPKLYNKLTKLSINISIFALQWIVCLFTTIFPYYMIVILWDLLFLQGSSILLKATIVLIDQIEPIIMDCNQIIQFLTNVQSFKKKSNLEEGIFFNRLKAIFIDRDLLQLARDVYTQLMVGQDKNVKKKNIPSISCDLKWPICHQLLNKNKIQRKDADIWVFKDEGPPKMIENYLQSKLKGLKVFVEDSRQPLKKLSIGRTHHICNTQLNNDLRVSRINIELSEYDPQTNSYDLPQNSIITQSSRRFLNRATFINQTFIFNINSQK